MSVSAERCKQAALKYGADKVWGWTREALEQTQFFEDNRDILDQPRGSGYWAWKPFIILQTLKKVNRSDVVVYMDAGVECIASLGHIVGKMDGLWLFGNMYNHRDWCKGDTMEAMNVFPDGKQCQASAIFVRNVPEANVFMSEWLYWCTQKHVIDDTPSIVGNYPGFQDHRHDQAILTCMAAKCGIPLHWWPAIYNNGAFIYPSDGYVKEYPPLFHHHRKRNHDY